MKVRRITKHITECTQLKKELKRKRQELENKSTQKDHTKSNTPKTNTKNKEDKPTLRLSPLHSQDQN